LTQFLGINDNGLAVGYYQTNDGSQHGFLYDIAAMSYSLLDDPFAAG
jgi:probable HAF family extracellular repeat protein